MRAMVWTKRRKVVVEHEERDVRLRSRQVAVNAVALIDASSKSVSLGRDGLACGLQPDEIEPYGRWVERGADRVQVHGDSARVRYAMVRSRSGWG